ncbi:MAG TPA: methylmalonyl-CoA mutase subunit beta [Methyloceanibacter sp.]|nr:methylmalonyl-CoA mutase subunit beta [Methyloceanibacter sp.]
MAELSLARDFPPALEADWQALVKEALKGAPLTSLCSTTYDGIVIEPLYARAQDRSLIPGRAPGMAWEVMQRIDLPDAEAANTQVLDDLNNAANGLVLVFQGAVGDYGYALPATEDAIGAALKGVHLDAGITVELDFGPPSRQAAGIVANYVNAKGLAPSSVNIRFGFDPLGAMATRGIVPKPWSELAPEVTGLIAGLAEQGFTGPFAVADGRPVHAAGGSDAQELALAVANAVAYLRALEARGVSLEDARRFIFFRLAADQDQFLTIAKFRAIRKLWDRVGEACGLKPSRACVTAETAWRMMTRRDPHGNIVRGTIAALAAAIGGADTVTVLPFSAALGVPDAFARRIARNTQTILIEEANLHRVADPATGSGAIEYLSDQLCEKAWVLFQRIERAGGADEALEAGLIQQVVAKVRAEREANIARRKDSLIGTSDFPHLAGERVRVSEAAKASPSSSAAGAKTIESLSRVRLAEPFERLRDRSDAYLSRHGQRPRVFLACLGRASDFTARASFAKSLFESGGIEAVEGSGDNLMKRFKDSGATLACLCSSDKVFAGEAVSAAKALGAAGASHIFLAGKPGDHAEAWKDAGIRTFLHQGCDTLGLLQDAYEKLGA